jgi:hypothetical protein
MVTHVLELYAICEHQKADRESVLFGYNNRTQHESEVFKMSHPSNFENEPKKPYQTPQLTEHGTVEEITGFDEGIGASGVPTESITKNF